MEGKNELVELTAEIVAAYVGNNPVPQADLPRLISEVYKLFNDNQLLYFLILNQSLWSSQNHLDR